MLFKDKCQNTQHDHRSNTISSIIVPSTFAVWFAKYRFQPDIETSLLTKIEAAAELEEEETIVTNRRLGNKIR